MELIKKYKKQKADRARRNHLIICIVNYILAGIAFILAYRLFWLLLAIEGIKKGL